MKICWQCLDEKSTDRFGRLSASSDGLNPRCKTCSNTYAAAYRASHSEQMRTHCRKWYANNRDRCITRVRLWKQTNIEVVKDYNADYYALNKDYYKSHLKKWRKKNQAKVNTDTATRYAIKLQASPAWADVHKILKFYERAITLTKKTGVLHVVDHKVPLQSKRVCGLHVEHNLQVITNIENISKSNRWWPDMPDDEDDGLNF